MLTGVYELDKVEVKTSKKGNEYLQYTFYDSDAREKLFIAGSSDDLELAKDLERKMVMIEVRAKGFGNLWLDAVKEIY